MNGCIQRQCYGNVAGNLSLHELEGERKQTQKRGFATKREAQAWEHEVMLKQKKFSETLARETEVWISEMPEHMIHLNGDKFLGPR